MIDEVGPLPRWNLDVPYPGTESPEFAAALTELDGWIDEHEKRIETDGIGAEGTIPADDAALAAALEGYLDRANRIFRRYGTLSVYLSEHVTTNSYDAKARRKASELEARGVRLSLAGLKFRLWVPRFADRLDALCERSETIAKHRFPLEETIEHSDRLMEAEEERLASELAPSGGSAWNRLHGTVTSQIEVPFERDGKTERLPMSRIRALVGDPDPEIRRRAHEVELAAWADWREPLAAALNGVKGWAVTLNRKRGYADAIEPSLQSARIDRATLDALRGAIDSARPAFDRYYRAKAKLLGKAKLAWWDLAAPVGRQAKIWSFDEAAELIVRRFGAFRDRMGGMARRAFDERWVDAEPRAGKRGGAFCAGMPERSESRILMNYDGTFDAILTLAHELGHAYHNEVMGETQPMRRHSPMTLSETASIFAETLLFHAGLDEAADDLERLAILELFLQSASGVLIDIDARFLFEKAVFERREDRELAAEEFCELMEEAQRTSYGESIDPLHPYVWAAKPHFYSPGLSFYNYPYAFGLLFGLGLFAIWKERGDEFIEDYEGLLASTGLGKAADLAARFGIDIHDRAFWEAGTAEIARFIDRYETLAAAVPSPAAAAEA